MLVKEIMSKDVLYVSPEDTATKFISIMEKNHIHEVFVLKDNKLEGVVYSKKFADKGMTDPSKMKISTMMEPLPAHVTPEEDINKAAELLFNVGVRALPVVEDSKVVGIVSIYDIIEQAVKTKDFRQTKAGSIIVIPEILKEDADIGTARVIMRGQNISHIPIVDSKKNLVGLLTVFDLLRSIKPRERMGWYSMTGEKEQVMKIPVSTIMNTNPVTADEKESLSDIANKMYSNKISGVVIIKNKKPIGIITLKDLLEVYVSGLAVEGVYYHISGLEDEDDFIVSTIQRMIEDVLEKVSNIYNIDFFFLHIKRYRTGGKRIKYSIRTRLVTNKGLFISKSWAWDLRDAIAQALDSLDKIIFKKRFIAREKVKRNKRKLKVK